MSRRHTDLAYKVRQFKRHKNIFNIFIFLALVKATTGTRGRLADAPSAATLARVDKRAGRRRGEGGPKGDVVEGATATPPDAPATNVLGSLRDVPKDPAITPAMYTAKTRRDPIHPSCSISRNTPTNICMIMLKIKCAIPMWTHM